MFVRPRLFPVGTSYVRIPVAKTACMRLLLELTQRGYRHATWGLASLDKAPALADKFSVLYGTSSSRGARDYARSRHRAVSQLIMYPDDRSEALLWWLLATRGEGVVHEREQLVDTWSRPLSWRRSDNKGEWVPQYELVHLQRTRRVGGGRHWTWVMADDYYQSFASMLIYAAARKGRMRVGGDGRKHLTDNIARLDRLLESVRRMPGFHGIRQQKRCLFASTQDAWNRHHSPREWPDIGTWVDKHLHVYDGLTLDVLVGCMLAQRRTRQAAPSAQDFGSSLPQVQ